MPRVIVPSVLRSHCGGKSAVEVEGATVAAALENLNGQYPGLRQQLMNDDGQLKSHVNVFVNDENIRDRQQTQTPLDRGDEILLVPALAGG